MQPSPIAKRSRSLTALIFLGCFTMVIGILYYGRTILIPFALAILLTFILSPVVNTFRRWGAGQILSVVVTVVLSFAVLGSIGTVIAFEFKGLANELPGYRQNIRQKISDIRNASKSESLSKVKAIAQEVVEEFKAEPTPNTKGAQPLPAKGTNAPVVVQEKPATEENGLPIDSLLEPLGSAGLVIVLVIFMLLRREDLRDRLLHLCGRERLIMTTKAIEEIGDKVSRYLVRQCLLNMIYGIGITIGLALIGLPYAVLWGFLAAIARFIPYAGPVIGAVAPMMMSLAVFDSWMSPLMVIGLILTWELINNMILEPVIYGQGTGISEVALLIMMAFWTWLWGAVGLVLAAPLTVCMFVICKGIPELNFISIMLGSKAALTPQHALYQRLVAQNHDEATILMKDFLKNHTREELYERMLMPVLRICRDDRAGHRLSGHMQRQVLEMLHQVLDEIRPKPEQHDKSESSPHPLIVGCPVRNGIDETALHLLSEMLAPERTFMPVISGQLDDKEKLAEVVRLKPSVLCLGMLSDEDTERAAELTRKLRVLLPHLTVVAGCWSTDASTQAQPESALANHLTISLPEARDQLLAFRLEPDDVTSEHPVLIPVSVT